MSEQALTFWGREGRGGLKAALKTRQISRKGEKKNEKKKRREIAKAFVH